MWDFSKFTITAEILSLIAEVDEFKGAWQLFGRLAPERLQALRHVATIESIGASTRIEGAKLSDQEIEKLLSNLAVNSFRSRDEQEVGGYAFVCNEIFLNYDVMPLSENIIKQLHGWLLQFSDKDERHRGEYKKLNNHIEAFDQSGKSLGVIFETATPFETPRQMEELIYWTREQIEAKILHPLLTIAIFAVIFLAIHPFQDGNGRLSRLLTTWLLLKSGYAYIPYSSLESIIENNKESYYLALRKTQTTLKTDFPDFSPWVHFFLRALGKQKRHLETKLKREKMLYAKLPLLSTQILTVFGEHGKLSIGNLEHLTQINRNTLKKHLQDLTHNGYLNKAGKGRATQYYLAF